MIAWINMGRLHTQGSQDLTYQLYLILRNALGSEWPSGHFNYRWAWHDMPGLYLMDSPGKELILEVHSPEAELFVLMHLPEGLELCYAST